MTAMNLYFFIEFSFSSFYKKHPINQPTDCVIITNTLVKTRGTSHPKTLNTISSLYYDTFSLTKMADAI